ncbi:TetR/AcrR family transcriptional regulator [Actinomycetospora sp. TBRC 11914]|uniref:TetR/AcrR family transcriptional regulator n=1 Tax=Actinomycetospora sp. TBRC 11914 TaxID=2729387 RepID=UPI00145FC32B|nr:TetR/AcrR family transcriptional regulator [Actinomycetospora sp. TBRC 11914]NMO91708.1 TetR/AcrR family transcriptional regulator [Actinomycetospora sp. TBRC 11914]
MTGSRPRGSEAVSEALVDAARSLLAERSPRAISGRELADRAGVNYGQIHHHFGTKDQLFAEALRRNAEEFLAEEMAGGTREPVPIVVDRADGLWRTLAHLALDHANERSPEDAVMQRFLRLRAEALGLRRTHLEVRSQVATVVALQFGWGLFDRSITSGLGVAVDADALGKGVAERSTRLVNTDLADRNAELIREPRRRPGPRPEPHPCPAPPAGRGPDAVRARLVDAARRLLTEKSPRAIAGRELAARAGVNYGQIHHYFGSVDGVFRAALADSWEQYVHDHMTDVDPDRPAAIVTDPVPGVWETAAHRALDPAWHDDAPVATLVRRRHLVAEQWRADPEEPAVVEAAAAYAGLQYGWGVFERFVVGGLGIPDSQVAAVRRRARELSRLLTLRP